MASASVQTLQATTAPAESGSGGLPQFDTTQWPGQMVWMLIIFGIMFLLFAKVFVPKVGGVMANREDRISGDFQDARRLRDEAQATSQAAAAELAQARAHVQKLVHEARAKARAETAAREAKEEAKIAEILARSEAQLTATRTAAMSHVREIAEQAAVTIVAKLTGNAASADEMGSAAADA